MNAPHSKDEALIAAWRDYTIARAIFSVLPDEAKIGECESAAEKEQIAIMDPAEEYILAAEPQTLRGVEIKLWFSLARNIDAHEVAILCALREDLRYFGDYTECDLHENILLSSIRSLRVMQSTDGIHRTPFAVAMDAYRSAFNAANAYWLLNFPGFEGDFTEFEPAFDEHVSKVHQLAIAALLVPVATSSELADKQIIVDQQASDGWQPEVLAPVMRQMIADGIALSRIGQ